MGRVTHADTQRMMTWLLARRENVAKYYVTVTAGQTHTIQSLGVSAATAVYWGDGLTDTYTGTAKRTHIYVSAGTYEVKIYTPENVTTFDLRDRAAVSVLNSADLKGMVNVRDFKLLILTSAAITLNSSDMVDWRPSGTFQLNYLPNAAITLNSSDMVDWRPSGTFQLYDLPSATGTLNSSDMVDWRPSGAFQLYNLPNATGTLNSSDMVDWRPGFFQLHRITNATITITPSTIKNWSTTSTIDLRTGNLTQAQADLVLWECYQIARTATGGTINMAIAGNAAPSGTFQAATSCPVTAATPGKEIAHELLNNGCAKSPFNVWATVSTN